MKTNSLKPNIIAVIVAIEQYRHADISKVHYANNDALAFKKMLEELFNVPEENITCWINSDANKTSIEEDLPYKILQLSENDCFLFYYAGHGFHNAEGNRLTVWDTHKNNLVGTTVSIKDILLTPLEKSACNQSMIFLDSCAEFIKDNLAGRDMISSMSIKEFADFGTADKFHAIFYSCTEGQKSFPCDKVQHGVWTWHLIEALKGNKPEAIFKDAYITDQTLQNYLRVAVPKYISSEKISTKQQIPFATISSSNTIILRQLPVIVKHTKPAPADFRLQFSELFLRRVDEKHPRELQGFKKGNSAPKWVNDTTRKFIQESAGKDIEEEIQIVYENAKKILQLTRSEIQKTIKRGHGTIKTDQFRYELSIFQHNEKPAVAVIKRTIVITTPTDQLTKKFNEIFPNYPDEVVIPLEESLGYDRLVELFEGLEKTRGGTVSDDDSKGQITYENTNQVRFVVDLEAMEMIIYPGFGLTPTTMIETAIDDLKELGSGTFLLEPARTPKLLE